MSVNGGYRYNHNVSLTGSYVKNFIKLPAGDFDTDLIGLRFNWSFTSKSFIQTFSQYNSQTQRIGHNVRFGLMSTSSTGLFVVFNNTDATHDYSDPHEVRRRNVSRALFIKFNYLFDR